VIPVQRPGKALAISATLTARLLTRGKDSRFEADIFRPAFHSRASTHRPRAATSRIACSSPGGGEHDLSHRPPPARALRVALTHRDFLAPAQRGRRVAHKRKGVSCPLD